MPKDRRQSEEEMVARSRFVKRVYIHPAVGSESSCFSWTQLEPCAWSTTKGAPAARTYPVIWRKIFRCILIFVQNCHRWLIPDVRDFPQVVIPWEIQTTTPANDFPLQPYSCFWTQEVLREGRTLSLSHDFMETICSSASLSASCMTVTAKTYIYRVYLVMHHHHRLENRYSP